MKIPISEIFYTLSGEGRLIGVPTTYIRFYGCNMKSTCPFCDSLFAVKGNKYKPYTINQIVDEVVKIDCGNVAFTGGEPFKYIKDIHKIITELLPKGFLKFHFETNGKIFYEPWYSGLMTFSISPKLHAIDKKYKQTLEEWASSSCHLYFKFVYEGLETVEEIKQLEYDIGGFGFKDVYIMPVGRGFDKRMYQECYQVCLDNNWRLSPRMQCIVWDDARGK